MCSVGVSLVVIPAPYRIQLVSNEYREGVSNMGPAVKRSRKYDASRRQQQARETQRAIIRAAQRLFVDQGYGRTTMTEVAAAAGVSVETVYAAFRNKATLL